MFEANQNRSRGRRSAVYPAAETEVAEKEAGSALHRRQTAAAGRQ